MIITITRTIVLYIFVTLGIRLMGKRQIGEMQPNELVITLLISEIAAIPLQDTSQPILNGVVAIFMLVILEIIISVITMKSLYVRKIMNGKSAVIIKNGVIDQNMMRQVRMTVLDLVELLRGQALKWEMTEREAAVPALCESLDSAFAQDRFFLLDLLYHLRTFLLQPSLHTTNPFCLNDG